MTQNNGNRNTGVARGREPHNFLAGISLLIAFASAGFAWWAAHEAREARVDGIRTRVKSQALADLLDARTAFAQFNCYLAVRGKLDSVSADKEAMEAKFRELEPRIRQWLSEISSYDEASLLAFEKASQGHEAPPTQQLKEVLLKARATWSKEDIERADAACKI
ncbi:hypothetical protein L602_000800000270 [Cupriavidus gilardii J11]|uniref:Uncharacterized protein n=1 Tax=Cupriavidus gilardii J11 TaxID=936133 RepID=A0A562B1S1_9BURK|nr:hypothetical protein [Cupriavidus gilardii]TWG78958.1 hypothetical protein L602_000800000270 [Cupriavidus gilardii J11]